MKSQAKRLAMVLSVLGMTAAFPPYLFSSLDGAGSSTGWTGKSPRHLRISPEGGKVPIGAPVTITVELLQAFAFGPSTLVRSGPDWQEAAGNRWPVPISI